MIIHNYIMFHEVAQICDSIATANARLNAALYDTVYKLCFPVFVCFFLCFYTMIKWNNRLMVNVYISTVSWYI